MSWHEVAFSSSYRANPPWSPPSGCLRLIFDGSVVGSLGPSGIRGVITDSLASCMLSFLGP